MHVLITLFLINSKKEIIDGVKTMGISYLSEIQKISFQYLLNSDDNMCIVSDCGTGKTLLYSITAVNAVNTSNAKLQVLCICATYETAMQTANVFRQIAIYTLVKILKCY